MQFVWSTAAEEGMLEVNVVARFRGCFRYQKPCAMEDMEKIRGGDLECPLVFPDGEGGYLAV